MNCKVCGKEIKQLQEKRRNCHHIEHSNVYNEFLIEVENYKGSLLDW